MIFVGAGLVPAQNGGKHKALPLQNANDFLIGINSNRHYTDLMIFVGAGLVPAQNGGKHKALPLQNANDF